MCGGGGGGGGGGEGGSLAGFLVGLGSCVEGGGLEFDHPCILVGGDKATGSLIGGAPSGVGDAFETKMVVFLEGLAVDAHVLLAEDAIGVVPCGDGVVVGLF